MKFNDIQEGEVYAFSRQRTDSYGFRPRPAIVLECGGWHSNASTWAYGVRDYRSKDSKDSLILEQWSQRDEVASIDEAKAYTAEAAARWDTKKPEDRDDADTPPNGWMVRVASSRTIHMPWSEWEAEDKRRDEEARKKVAEQRRIDNERKERHVAIEGLLARLGLDGRVSPFGRDEVIISFNALENYADRALAVDA